MRGNNASVLADHDTVGIGMDLDRPSDGGGGSWQSYEVFEMFQ